MQLFMATFPVKIQTQFSYVNHAATDWTENTTTRFRINLDMRDMVGTRHRLVPAAAAHSYISRGKL